MSTQGAAGKAVTAGYAGGVGWTAAEALGWHPIGMLIGVGVIFATRIGHKAVAERSSR